MVLKIILAVILFILFVPLRVNFLFYINLLKNRGAIAVQLWRISITQGKFQIADGQVTTTNQRNKAITIDLSLEDKSVIFLDAFTKALIKKITLDKTYIGIEIGKKDDAMATSVISGSVLILIDIVFAQILTKKSGSHYFVDNESLYTTNKLTLSLQNVLYVTTFDAFWSAFRGYLIMRKQVKKQKQG